MTKSLPQFETPPQQVVIEDDEIDLQQYLYVLSKYKWSILGFTFALSLLVMLVVFSVAPTFKATATILIEAQGQKVVSIEEVYGLPGVNREYFETQNRILQSRYLADKVVDQLNIPKHPEFDPTVEKTDIQLDPRAWIPKDWLGTSEPPNEHSIQSRIVSAFMGRLTVKPIRFSQLIEISFEANDPELTAKVANTLAEVYIESDLEGRLNMTKKAADWIAQRLGGLREKVEESEIALQAYREKEGLVDVQGVDSLVAKELDDITLLLVQAQRDVTGIKEIYRQVKELEGQPIQAYESIPVVLRDTTVQNTKEVLSTAELKVAELSKRYGRKHPKMIAAVDEVATAKIYLDKQIMNVVASVAKEYKVIEARARQLQNSFNATRNDVKVINRKENTLRTLQREVDSNRSLYELFLTREKETNVAGDLQAVKARLVDPAVVPTKPSKPQKRLILLITIFIGLIGSAMMAFILEALDNTIKDSADVSRRLDLPMLGTLPKLNIWKDKDRKALRYFSDNSATHFSESIRTIRTGVLLTGMDDEKKVVLVSSSVPNEGKSVVAVNLALSLGPMGRVLLIDADMRRPSILDVFGLKHSDPGLSHYIAGTKELNECIYHFEDEDIYVMPAGIVPPNPLEMLSSVKFKKAMQAVRESFDHIVIDSAPLIAVSDSIVLSQYVNSIVYVVKADDTPYQAVIEGKNRLQKVHASITGVVLNMHTPAKRSGRYGAYGYGSDYYHYQEYYGNAKQV